VHAMTAVTLRRRGNLQCLQGLSGNFPPRVTAAVHSGMEKTILVNNSSFDVCVISSGISGGINAKETMRRRRSFSDLGVALDRLQDRTTWEDLVHCEYLELVVAAGGAACGQIAVYIPEIYSSWSFSDLRLEDGGE
jgi:hypothetical protein